MSYPNVKAATKALVVAKSNRYNIGIYNKLNNQKQIRDRSLNRETDQETPVIVEEMKPKINFVPREGHSLDIQILRELQNLKLNPKIKVNDTNTYQIDFAKVQIELLRGIAYVKTTDGCKQFSLWLQERHQAPLDGLGASFLRLWPELKASTDNLYRSLSPGKGRKRSTQ